MIEVIFFEELRLRSIRDQEVRRLLVRHQTMGRLFGVWLWWSLGFWGLREKKEADRKKMKLILSTIHLTQVAFFGRKITGEDDLSHHVQHR